MSPAEFLRLPECQRTLELAHQTAALPIAVHAVEGEREGLRAYGWGGCAVCAHVLSLPGGRAACRASRAGGSAIAMRQRRPIAFVCHAGLSNLTLSAWEGAPFAITLGPYVPEGTGGALADAVAEGLSLLTGVEVREAPVSLADVRAVPAGAPLAAAQWLQDSLGALWEKHRAPRQEELPLEAKVVATPAPRRRSTAAAELRFPAETVALLLMAGNRRRARAIIAEALETRGTGTPGLRAMALGALVVDAAQKAGADTTRARAAMAEQAAALADRALSSAEAVRLVMKALARLAPGRAQATNGYAELDALVSGRLWEPITLNEVAKELGQLPSTITMRLQKKFGLSFTEYLGRLRMEEAKRLLRRTRLSATEVSRRVGIGDQSNFTKVFKRHTGLTPGDYRARHGAR